MTATERPVLIENPAELLADPELLLEFVSTQEALGVKVKAMAKKLGISRSWFYVKVAEAQQASKGKLAPTPTSVGPVNSIPEAGSNTINASYTHLPEADGIGTP